MIEIGKHNLLRVARSVDFGYYLSDGETEILLPLKYIPEGLKVGDEIEVFIYKDSEDRLIATTLKPLAEVGEFAYLKIKEINRTGAFLEWGLEKDLMIPFREQSGNPQSGQRVMVYVFFDHRTDRIAASMKINDFFRRRQIDLEEDEEVDLLISNPTALGYNVIINNSYEGLIYSNEIHRKINVGDNYKGYIRKIREDNKIDVTLDPPGMQKVEPGAQLILDQLKFNGGFLPLHDKSDPQLIKDQLGMSKKTFKKAVGSLYKSRKIKLEEDGIHLI